MPVMGPTYSDQLVEDIYQEAILLLRKYGIQNTPGDDRWPNWRQYRDSRNARLKRAIEKLVELQSWENF